MKTPRGIALRHRFEKLRCPRDARAKCLAAAALICAAAFVWVPGPAPAQQVSQQMQRFETAPLAVLSDGARHEFTVEIARTDAQRAQGLMFRRTLAPDRGMLFLYGSPRVISMWMKNTFTPLDMVFIGAGGTVVSVHERAVPGSLAPISSQLRAVAVLEVPGGTVARLSIRPGDRVVNRFLAGRP